jgi:hypothetical protein
MVDGRGRSGSSVATLLGRGHWRLPNGHPLPPPTQPGQSRSFQAFLDLPDGGFHNASDVEGRFLAMANSGRSYRLPGMDEREVRLRAARGDLI